MLFTRLQRQHIPAPALLVDGFTDNATRHVADQRLFGGNKPKGWAAEREWIAQALPITHGNIDPHFARRF